jgi:hypothetical protein
VCKPERFPNAALLGVKSCQQTHADENSAATMQVFATWFEDFQQKRKAVVQRGFSP